MLMLGIAGELAQSETPGATRPSSSPPRLTTVVDSSTVVMAALQTPPYPLVVSRGAEMAVGTLVDCLEVEGLSLPGVNGPAETAQTFAERWTGRTGRPAPPGMRLRVHRLTRVIDPPSPAGAFRPARPSDVPLLAEWGEAFNIETGVGDARSGMTIVETRMAAGGLYVWDHEGPVSMAAWSGPTPTGVRVNFVYTPTELRGRGYASACVASLSRLLLQRGHAFCGLFTDLANPISNRIYRCIGYEPVCDFTEYRFT